MVFIKKQLQSEMQMKNYLNKILDQITVELELTESQEGAIEKVKQWDDPIYYTVHNVIGKSVKEATKELYPLEIEYSGTGDKVVEQSPSAGEKVTSTSKVRLLLGE